MKKSILVMILVGLGLRIWFALTVPFPAFQDEQAHYNYAKFIHDNKALPKFSDPYWKTKATPEKHSYENYHMPLYYVMASLFSGPKGMRLYSCFLFLLSALFLSKLPIDRWVFLFFCFAPTLIYMTAFVTNDALLLCASCAVICCVVRAPNSNMIFLCSLAALVFSKFTGLVMGVAMLVLLASSVVRLSVKLLWLAALQVGIVALGVVVFLERYACHQNSVSWTLSIERYVDLIPNTLSTFSMGISPDVIGPASTAFGVLVSGALIVYLVLKYRLTLRRNTVVLFSIIGVWALFAISHNHYAGRLLIPALPWIVVLEERKEDEGRYSRKRM